LLPPEALAAKFPLPLFPERDGKSMLRRFRQGLESRGIYIRRSRQFDGIDPYLDLSKLVVPQAQAVAFDVGSNCGQTVAAIRRVFPQLPVHGFEPVAASYAIAQRNCVRFADVTLVHAAVGARRDRVTFYSEGASQLASLRDTSPAAGRVANTVDVITLDDYAQERGIDTVCLLKTDTEGFDLGVLQGASRLLREGRVATVLCEVGFARADHSHSHFAEIMALMEQQGFALACFYDQPGFWHLRDWGFTFANALFVRRDALVGRATAPATGAARPAGAEMQALDDRGRAP
jgi:FkbM family methyltransferase